VKHARSALLSASLLLACAKPGPVSLNDATQSFTRKDYADQLKKWTRNGHVIYDFDEAMNVDATLRSPEFRSAYAAKYLEDYQIVPENRERIRGEILSDGADSFEFHVETATHDYDINDLTGARTVWRVTLIDAAGHEVKPSTITPDKSKRPLEMEFYPYATQFSRGWRLRFPRALADGTPLVGGNDKLTLRFAGPPGVVDLVWQIQP
jgi:hypothetical protein